MMREHGEVNLYARLFAPLLDLVFPPRPAELAVRNLPADGLVRSLAPETRTLESCAAVSLLSYDDPAVRACVLEAKFHGNVRAAELLAHAAAEYLGPELTENGAFGRAPAVLVPVPLSSARMRERGYNQTERIARHCARLLGNVQIENALLLRVRDTQPQTELDGAARRRNVRGAFTATRAADPRAQYIVLDDVTTTGATMQETVRALRAAGAQHVQVVALARG